MNYTERKKELKRPDEFVSFFGDVIAKLVKKRETLYFALGAFAIVGAGVVYWESAMTKTNQEAANAWAPIVKELTEKSVIAEGEKAEFKSMSKEMEEFLHKYETSSLAPSVRLQYGTILLRSGQYGKAYDSFSKAESELDEPQIFLAREGKGLSRLEDQKFSEAEKIFQELSKAPSNPLKDQHTWYLGLALEGAKKTAEAIALYTGFSSKYPDSPLLDQVGNRLHVLQGK